MGFFYEEDDIRNNDKVCPNLEDAMNVPGKEEKFGKILLEHKRKENKRLCPLWKMVK